MLFDKNDIIIEILPTNIPNWLSVGSNGMKITHKETGISVSCDEDCNTRAWQKFNKLEEELYNLIYEKGNNI